jgi:hypothetical protein
MTRKIVKRSTFFSTIFFGTLHRCYLEPLASAGRKHDFTQRLPVGWKNTLEENDHNNGSEKIFF